MNKYTVIIPVRDRIKTLSATLRSCLRQDHSGLQILVSDNQSTDGTFDLAERMPDQRLRWIRSPQRLSMSAHFDFALDHVDDGFVLFLGGDDALLPGAVAYADAVFRSTGMKALSGRQISYVWPDAQDGDVAGRLDLMGWRDRHVEVRSAKSWLERALKFRSEYIFDLPGPYCGFVDRDLLRSGSVSGRFFGSINPDAYGAYAVALQIDEYAYSHRPFLVAGASASSTGASTSGSVSDGKESKQYYQEVDQDFHSDFVLAPSLPLFSAEAFSQAALRIPALAQGLSVDRPALLRAMLGGMNPRTAPQVRLAVETMAARWGVHIPNPGVQGRSRLPQWKSLCRLGSAWHGQFTKLAKTQDLGLKDVDDAAVFCHALILANCGLPRWTIGGRDPGAQSAAHLMDPRILGSGRT